MFAMTQIIQTEDYPFVEKVLTDNDGQIRQVVLQIDDYLRLIEALEDEGLYRAMQRGKDERPLSLEEARRALADDESRVLTSLYQGP